MKQTKDQERAEVIYTDQGINVAKDGVLVVFIPWEQASRRVQVVQVPNDVAALVAAAQALVLDPTSHVKKLQLEAHAWGPLAAAPQPPEAAPVQMPDCAGKVLSDPDYDDGSISWRGGMPPQPGTKLYTEQQVRELLAAHGIGGAA